MHDLYSTDILNPHSCHKINVVFFVDLYISYGPDLDLHSNGMHRCYIHVLCTSPSLIQIVELQQRHSRVTFLYVV